MKLYFSERNALAAIRAFLLHHDNGFGSSIKRLASDSICLSVPFFRGDSLPPE
jgi:hypothetical protein